MQPRMPVLFLGHGSPMNAVAENDFTKFLNLLGEALPRPQAVLVISAHWMTKGKTKVTHMLRPNTIHDFYGFPKKLFAVEYPAPGSPELAERIHGLISHPQIELDDDTWGLDHGTWSILKFLYPKADVPVIQLSMDMTQDGRFHFNLGKQLLSLRDQGVLILASGNIVHNLKAIDWNENAEPHSWAVEFDAWTKEQIDARNFDSLIQDPLTLHTGRLSVPTPDHYYPLLYALGAADREDRINHIYEGFQNASISMRCLKIG